MSKTCSTRAVAVLVVTLVIGGCGKKGPALPPLRPTLPALSEVKVVQLGKEVRVIAAVPAVYTDGTPFELSEVRVDALEIDANAIKLKAAAVASPRLHMAIPIANDPGRSKTEPLVTAQPALERDYLNETLAGEATGSSKVVTTPIDSSASTDPVAVQREGLHRILLHRFEESARSVLSLTSAVDLAAARRGDWLDLRVPVSVDPGVTVGIAVHLSGNRPHDRGSRSGVILFDPVVPGPTPHAPTVVNSPTGLHVDLGATTDVLTLAELEHVNLVAWPGAVLRRSPVMALYKRRQGESFGALPFGGLRGQRQFYDRDAVEGQQLCYATARAASGSKPLSLSYLSDEVCVVRRDTFPPEAPAQPRAFPSQGGVLLVWEPSVSDDVQGYRVYRGAKGEKLEPIGETPAGARSYLDRSAGSGVIYEYRVTALDRATPANESPPSTTVTERAP